MLFGSNSRGVGSALIAPNCPNKKFVWLRILKNSARNSRCICSRIGNCLTSEVSQVLYPGPSMMLRPALPNVPCTLLSTKAHVLNNVPGTHGLVLGLPTRLGREQLNPTVPPQSEFETETISVAV